MAGMKVFLAVALFLCVLCVGAIPLRDSIMMDAHRCCVSSCSSWERELLENQLALYGGADADSVKAYYQEAVSGSACTSHSRKRASSSKVVVPYGPIDVQNGDVSFDVVVTLQQDSGIQYGYTYASYYNYSVSKSIYPENYYYGDNGSNATTVTRTIRFIIPQYAYSGNWTVTTYSYGYAPNTYTPAAGVFNVAKTINEGAPPKLTSITVPVLNANEVDKTMSFTATDDLSGVQSVQISMVNITGYNTVAYGSYSVPSGLPRQLTLSSAITYFYNYTELLPGTYDLTAYVYDNMGSYVYYSTAQLKALGIQSQVVIAVGTCNPGRKLAYGAPSSSKCTLCDKGTFSNYGAFRCKACLPGTASNVAGATNCTKCPPGTAGIGGSAGCEICPAGTFTNSYGNAQCLPCQPGTNSTEGSEYCSTCPPGTYSLGGTATCSPCGAGMASSYGSYYCDPCAPGYYMATTGASMCMLCPAGTFSWVGATSCTPCPSPTLNGPAGSNSRLNCY